MNDAIRNRTILQVVLLKTLVKYPDGVSLHTAYEDIDENFEFPAAWYRELPASKGYDELQELGYSDWRQVPQERLIELVSTEPQWQNEIRWARNELRKNDFLDTSAPRGIWKLTPKGERVANANPEKGLSREERKIAAPRSRKIRHTKTDGRTGRTRREELVDRLRNLTISMPLVDLELLVDIARIVRMRSLEE